MNEQKLKTVKQWLEALQESARTAVEALSKDKPLAEDPPSLDERSKNLGAAIHKIRELVRPAPRTVAFLEEEAWYRMKRETKPGEKPDPAAGTGAFFTKPEILDAVLGNPPLDIPPAAEPIDPNAPKMERGERHMSNPEAAFILADMAFARRNSVDDVTALQMGVNRLMVRHFQKQRNWARRRAARLRAEGATESVPPIAPEEAAEAAEPQREVS